MKPSVQRVIGIAVVVVGAVLALGGVVGLLSGNGDSQAIPSPSPTPTTEGSPTPAPSTPTPAASTPTPTASATTSVPASEVSSEPTAPPTGTAPPAVDAAARTFMTDFVGWLRDGDGAALYAHLHPAVISRYGEDACVAYTDGIDAPDDYEIEVDRVAPPESWSYETDGRSTRVSDVVAVVGRRGTPGALEPATFHLGEVEGEYAWFTDCGEPL